MAKRKDTTSPSGKNYHPPIPKTDTQKKLLDTFKDPKKELAIVTGPAGVGKSYLCACYAGYLYKHNVIKKIVLSRPNAPTGRSIGFLPGELNEKMLPWVAPFVSTLEEYLSKGAVETMLRNGSLEIVPFEVIRGRTFNDAFVMLDEAQNCTKTEIKAFVTRHGEGCLTVINGDLTQSDIPPSNSGLDMICKMYKKSSVLQEPVELVEFTHDDIVRSEMCKAWVKEFST